MADNNAGASLGHVKRHFVQIRRRQTMQHCHIITSERCYNGLRNNDRSHLTEDQIMFILGVIFIAAGFKVLLKHPLLGLVLAGLGAGLLNAM